jgi:hypothetical protein
LQKGGENAELVYSYSQHSVEKLWKNCEVLIALHSGAKNLSKVFDAFFDFCMNIIFFHHSGL